MNSMRNVLSGSIAAAALIAGMGTMAAAQRGPAGPQMRGDGPPPESKPFSITRSDPALDAIISPNAKIETLATGFGINEGVIWIREGNSGYVLVGQPDRQRLLQDHQRPQGLGVHGEGRLHRQRPQSRRPPDAGRPDARDHHRAELRAAGRAGPARVVREPGLRGEAPREGRHADGAGRQLRRQALQRSERHRDQVGRRHLHRRQRRRPSRRRQKPAQADAEQRLAVEGREGHAWPCPRRNSAPARTASCSRSTRSSST